MKNKQNNKTVLSTPFKGGHDVTEVVVFQIVPLQAVLEFGETPSQQYMKGLALSVYTQCRRLLIQSLFGRPLTSFGPAAGNSKVLKSDVSTICLTWNILYVSQTFLQNKWISYQINTSSFSSAQTCFYRVYALPHLSLSLFFHFGWTETSLRVCPVVSRKL